MVAEKAGSEVSSMAHGRVEKLVAWKVEKTAAYWVAKLVHAKVGNLVEMTDALRVGNWDLMLVLQLADQMAYAMAWLTVASLEVRSVVKLDIEMVEQTVLISAARMAAEMGGI